MTKGLMEHLSATDEVLTLAGVSPGSRAEVKMDLQEAVFDKEAFREELRTQKLKVAKLEEQNLEIPEIRQELKDSRTWFMPRMMKPKSLGHNSRIIKDVMRDFASTERIWQKDL